MGNKSKKKHKHRSRSRDRSKRHKKHRRNQSSEDSSEDASSESRSRSPQPRRDKKRKHARSRSRSPKARKHGEPSSSASDSSDDSRERQDERKHRPPNSSASDSSDDSRERHDKRKHKRDRRQGEKLEHFKDQRKKQKELIKALETPEEKRARRLAKKEAKERKRKEKMGWDQDYLGYTNADNPFGDEHLLDAFVWGKKMDKEGKKSFSKDDIQKIAKSKMGENRRELEKVKKRRLEREHQLEEREQERERLQREKELEYFREWEMQEDTFHLHQAKLRSKIRIQDGRAKPIDLLAKYISAEDDELAIEMHEPYTYLHGLTITDLEDLLEDIKVYLELEQGKNTDYWRDIVTVTEDELNKLRKLDASTREYFGDRREGINTAVTSEVSNIFKGKTTNQLKLLEQQIREKLSGGEGIDIGYWESLLQQLKAHMARTRLRERHQDVLKQKLNALKREQGIDSDPLFPVLQDDSRGSTSDQSSPAVHRSSPAPGVHRSSPAMYRASPVPQRSSPAPQPGTSSQSEEQPRVEEDPGAERQDSEDEEEDGEDSEPLITEADLEEEAVDDYTAGSYSPRLLRNNELDIDAVVYDPVDDLKKLDLARDQVRTTGRVRLDGETLFEKKAREGMNDDEAQFSVEVTLDKQAFLWSDKYRPRKPRFFNRVHTGFEWNKYNQTHYDIDNPPPKIVQGYKFNIFYPDLIDKSATPEYTVTPCDDNKDFATLRFHAGPPYEDIAFKIVNREWEYSYKRGFRCQFQNNIFQLWFHFKRYRYRR
ncbi:cactin-like [Haliotis rufescens]|uniref:cactin-like n=1 Tax=Haliotis rufescens TaxID=6454 RepID=UPI00201FA6C3|nr:cactin-like [Haliotis rufescens]